MMKNVASVSFGTKINSLENPIKDAAARGKLKNEHIDNIEKLKNDGLDAELSIENNRYNSFLSLQLKSPALTQLETLYYRTKNEQKEYHHDKEYMDCCRAVEQEYNKDDRISFLHQFGITLTEKVYTESGFIDYFDTDAFLKNFTNDFNLPGKLAEKEKNAQTVINNYNNVVNRLDGNVDKENRLNSLFG